MTLLAEKPIASHGHLIDRIPDVNRKADRGTFVRNAPIDGLPDPPCPVSREFGTLSGVKFLYGPHKPEDSMLVEIFFGDFGSDVCPDDAPDQAIIVCHQGIEGGGPLIAGSQGASETVRQL